MFETPYANTDDLNEFHTFDLNSDILYVRARMISGLMYTGLRFYYDIDDYIDIMWSDAGEWTDLYEVPAG